MTSQKSDKEVRIEKVDMDKLNLPIRGFARKYSMAEYWKWRTPFKIYKCPLCDFFSTRLFSLKIHFKKHHIPPLINECPWCGEKFPTKGAIIEHCMKNPDLLHCLLYICITHTGKRSPFRKLAWQIIKLHCEYKVELQLVHKPSLETENKDKEEKE